MSAQDVGPAANAIASIVRLRLPPGQEIVRVQSPPDETGQAIGKDLVRASFKPRAIGSRITRAPHTGSASPSRRSRRALC
jgi:hypothetical protein